MDQKRNQVMGIKVAELVGGLHVYDLASFFIALLCWYSGVHLCGSIVGLD